MRKRRPSFPVFGCLVALATLTAGFCTTLRADSPDPRVTFTQDDDAGTLTVQIDGQEAFVYQYGDQVDLTHIWPLRSPSGKNMLVQQTQPFPHHRSLWFADTVRLEGSERGRFYDAYHTGQSGQPPFRDRIRHDRFTAVEPGAEGRYQEKLVWVMAHEIPTLDEQRDVRILPLGNGEYLLDMVFTLTASYGDVEFVSDAVHYAWPYLRINEKFHGDNGGTITNDRGQTGQADTNMQPAQWIDYSNTVDGTPEGVAVFQWPDGQTRRWLTREYGTFGPRRPDAQSGRPFTIPRDGTLSQRVGILVHQGDVETGRVRERYEAYIRSSLP